MEVRFTTKEESNARRQADFLKLSKTERVLAFFALCRRMKSFPVKQNSSPKKDNFLIVITAKWFEIGNIISISLFPLHNETGYECLWWAVER